MEIDLKNFDPIVSEVISGITVEALVRLFKKFKKTHTNSVKIEDAFFKERNSSEELIVAELEGMTITPESRDIIGMHISPDMYLYAELGSLVFATNSKINSVSLVHSSSDTLETIENISNSKKQLKFERLKMKSRGGQVEYISDCQLVYCSSNNFRIKNFLVCVDSKKNGFDIFILQTLQSPIGIYHHEYNVAEERKITSLEVKCQFIRKRFKVLHRIVFLNDLNSMLTPFVIDGVTIDSGSDTNEFMQFIDSFMRAYNLRLIE